MPISRSNVGEIEYRLSLYRDGERLSNTEGAFNLYNFCRGFEIRERIDRSTIEAQFVFEDAAGIINMMTGHEMVTRHDMMTCHDMTT